MFLFFLLGFLFSYVCSNQRFVFSFLCLSLFSPSFSSSAAAFLFSSSSTSYFRSIQSSQASSEPVTRYEGVNAEGIVDIQLSNICAKFNLVHSADKQGDSVERSD